MDLLTVIIIVATLLLGAVLLFAINVDFAKNKKATKVNGASGSPIVKKMKNKNSHSQSGKQSTSCIGSPLLKKSAMNNNSSDTKHTRIPEEKKADQNIPDLLVGQETKVNLKQQLAATGKAARGKKEPKQAKSNEVLEFGPSSDELDTSVAMEIFNHNCAKQTRGSKLASSKQSISFEDTESFENLSGTLRPTTPSYSSEQLFAMIAASNLSKDEIECTIEMLLEKINSDDHSDWKKPKNDPIERLKNQLRDNENILSVEIQNHEQTRARLVELKSQLQIERQSLTKNDEELAKLRKELSIADLALEQLRADLSRMQSVLKQRDEESSKIISRVEQEKMQLQNILANDSSRTGDFESLRAKYDEKCLHLKQYELSQQKFNERIADLESKLLVSEHLIDELRATKQHDDYEASAKISELKSDRMQLDKALKDQTVRLKEESETNLCLCKTVNELRLTNRKQDVMLKQMTDERQIHEASMKRTLQEMELELKELQQKLNANASMSQQDESRARRDDSAMSIGGEQEQKLISEMNQLRDGLAALFPDAVKPTPDSKANGTDWVAGYLVALKQLSKTLDELKESNNNNNCESTSPKKSMTDKATLTPRKKRENSSSPNSNGRSSRASTYHGHNDDKKLQETKLLEVSLCRAR